MAPKPFPFLSLPRELRDEIYEICLCKRPRIVPFLTATEERYLEAHNKDAERRHNFNARFIKLQLPTMKIKDPRSLRKHEPNLLSLLAVNRVIRNEAREIFFKINTFCLDCPAIIFHDLANRFWRLNASYLQHVEIHVNPGGVVAFGRNLAPFNPIATPQDWQSIKPRWLKLAYEVLWTNCLFGNMVWRWEILKDLQLKSLTINVEHCRPGREDVYVDYCIDLQGIFLLTTPNVHVRMLENPGQVKHCACSFLSPSLQGTEIIVRGLDRHASGDDRKLACKNHPENGDLRGIRNPGVRSLLNISQ